MMRLAEILTHPIRRWGLLTLASQYLLGGAAVLLAGMLAMGFWVTSQIAEGVIRNTAAATALYVDGVIAPLLPDIDGSKILAEGARTALDETLSSGALGERIKTFKLWGRGGLILYSNEPSLIGRRFEPTESLRQAWEGHVAAEFDDLADEEDALERNAGVPLLEIYHPIRAPWSGRTVAVAEFYEHAEDLEASLFAARVRSWIVVAAITIAMMGALFGIVLRGSGTIARQRHTLETQVRDLRELLRENRRLDRRVRDAATRLSALNERTLRQLSADLHDGPAQLLGLAALRLGSPSLAAGLGDRAAEIRPIRSFLDDAMAEIRRICRGLALPNIETLDLGELLRDASLAHERRTSTEVSLDVPETSPTLAPAEKLAIYRFVQEGLNNAFRHAGGQGQGVAAHVKDGVVTVEVRDAGPGLSADVATGLGLTGLRDRIESLGGTFAIESDSSGTRLGMALKPATAPERVT